MRTRAPDEWLAMCDGSEPATCAGATLADACRVGPSRIDCGALGSADRAVRERGALSLNVRLVEGLGTLHFARGRRQRTQVVHLLDGAGALLDVEDANRAFVGGVDRGLLTRWGSTAVCAAVDDVGEPASVAGPVALPCTAFDTACVRGRFEAEGSCCSAETLLAGTRCGEGGVCDGAGACVSPEEVAQPVPAPFDWLSVFSNGYPDGALLPREVADIVPVADAPVGMPSDSLEIRGALDMAAVERRAAVAAIAPDPVALPEPEEPLEMPVLAIVPPEVAGAGRVTILRSAEGAALNAIAYDGAPNLRGLVLADRGQPIDELFVVRGRLDELPGVLSDGSSEGTLRVPCDGVLTDGLRCARVGTSVVVVVVGDDVALAWVPPAADRAPTDVLVGGMNAATAESSALRPGRDFSMIAAAPPCTPQSCVLTSPAGCIGRRLCTSPTTLGPCIPRTETCDGTDQDCDGRTDEGTASLCNDGISCTLDYCSASTDSCANAPFGVLCTSNVSDCTVGICTNNVGVSNNERSFAASDFVVTPTGVPFAAGCTYRAGHSWCTNTWDSCNCNGPEMCTVRPRTGEVSGCTSAPIAAPGSPPLIYTACDEDGIACTAERACCEPANGGPCRADSLQIAANPTQYANRLAACGLSGNYVDSWLPVPGHYTLSGPVVCSRTNPFGGGSPYTDRCQADGNPCTVISCNETAGGTCTTTNPSGSAPSEQFVDPATGSATTSPWCNHTVDGTFGCSTQTCNGTSTCTTRAVGVHATYSCTGYDPNIPLPHAAADDPGHCATPQCQAGACNTIATANAANCPLFPASCGTGSRSCATNTAFASPEWPDLPHGCRPPAGFCYIGGPNGNNGTLDGGCVAAGTPRPGFPCQSCQPTINPFWWSPVAAGVMCPDDFNPCTTDLCSGSGTCAHNCVPTLPGCGASCDPF